VLRKDKEPFHTDVRPRDGIVEAVEKQLASGGIKGKTIHLCFTCDPYPRGYDTTPTREIIKLIKASGNHVQILTKNGEDSPKDFDLLDENDWFGVTISGYATIEAEPGASIVLLRDDALRKAWNNGIKTWVSYEPVLNEGDVIHHMTHTNYINRVKVGKLNYHPSNINWGDFGRYVEFRCKARSLDYYIKDDLRKEMEKQ
jgi:DNA repair photolyase